MVLAISDTPDAKPLEAHDCHLVTLPVCPLRVNTVLLVPVQTVAEPATVPPTEAGLTVTVTAARVEEGQEVEVHEIIT